MDSDDDIDWPHLRTERTGIVLGTPEGGSRLVGGSGDGDGAPSPVLNRSREKQRSSGAAGSTAPSSPLLVDGPAATLSSPPPVDRDAGVDHSYTEEAWDAVADMHGSSSSSSSISIRSDSSVETSLSSRTLSASSTSTDGEDPDDPVLPSSEQEQVPRQGEALPLESVEQLFAFLLLRGQTTVTQAAYRMMQRFYNGKMASGLGCVRRLARLPSLEAMRTTIAPRIQRAWALPMHEVKLSVVGQSHPLPVGVIFPSDHVRRDFAHRDTLDLFFLAGRRTPDERKWHPEFCDSRMKGNRAEVLRSGAVLQAFVVDGLALRAGDVVDVALSDGVILKQLTVGAGSFAGHEAGVRLDESVHAGDFTFSCSRDGCAVGVLNARHWLPSKHGKTTWHPPGLPVLRVTSLTLVESTLQPLPNTSGEESPPGRSHIGVDGLLTFVLSLGFFMDDFVCRAGRMTSSGGVYMIYLSWMYRHRVSRNAVRPVSLVPADVNSDLVLREIMHDLVEGATVGWVVTDADGRKMRVLADVALFIGDYKQVSKTSHLMGHTANAPCPLCSFTKEQGEGASFAGRENSREVSLVRTTARTMSVVAAARAVIQGENTGAGASGMSDGGAGEMMDEGPVSSDGSDDHLRR